jgi:FkbM family methyltransferase
MSSTINFSYQDKNVTIHGHEPHEVVTNVIVSSKNFFEISYLEKITKQYPIHKVVVDIGANIGNHAVYFSHFLDYTHLHAFEPHPANVELLQKNLNEFSSKTTIHAVGLSNDMRSIRLRTNDPNNSGGYATEHHDNIHETNPTSVVCDFYPLDHFKLSDVTFIKIDVEGHELPILQGAVNTILNNKPVVSVENLHYMVPWKIKKDIYHDFFASINYKLLEANVGGCYMETWIPSA